MKNRKTNRKEHRVAFDENEVPQSLKRHKLESISKHARKPLQGRHGWLILAIFKVSHQFRKLLLKQLIHNFLVYFCANHQLIVV